MICLLDIKPEMPLKSALLFMEKHGEGGSQKETNTKTKYDT